MHVCMLNQGRTCTVGHDVEEKDLGIQVHSGSDNTSRQGVKAAYSIFAIISQSIDSWDVILHSY